MAKVIFQLSSIIYFNFSIFNDLNLKKLAEIVGNETCVCFKSVPALYCTKSSPTHFPTGTISLCLISASASASAICTHAVIFERAAVPLNAGLCPPMQVP